ncbi:MAG: ParB/RepB/Spo0J family partition protein [Myxococcales bacterium]|nr:ParB/RepB/Spo0J family partition protein [Myxococcales bacterium]
MSRKRARITVQKAQETLSHLNLLSRFQKDGEPPRIEEVEVSRLMPNPYQPREGFVEEALEELAQSIQMHGFFGHLLVRPKGAYYELAFGERRLRAATMAGLLRIPVVVQELPDQAMMEIALTENLQREDLNPIEEALAFARMRDQFSYSVREIARRVAKSKSYVSSLLSLLRYPDVEEAVRTYDIPVRTAEELSRIEDETIRQKLLQDVIDGKLDRKGVMDARDLLIPTPPDPNLSLFGEEDDADEYDLDDYDDEDDEIEDFSEPTFSLKDIPRAPSRDKRDLATRPPKPPRAIRVLRQCLKLAKDKEAFGELDDQQRLEVQKLLQEVVDALPSLLQKS